MRHASVAAGLTLLLAATAAAAPVRLVRATLGSKGALQGSRFIVEDPRTAFAAGVDRQVIAYFEWEGGAPGLRQCVATFKDPTGAVVFMAPFTQRATGPRFSVYWTLALPENPKSGLWAVETTVDGEPAGTATFSIQAGAVAPQATGRRVLSTEEMYARANAAVVTVETLDANSRPLRRSSGFVLEDGRVVTAFQAVEGGARLRVTGPNGRAVETDRLTRWNRRQDWAVVSAPGVSAEVLATDTARSWKIGDRAFFLQMGADGTRAIAETAIVGAQEFPGRGSRLILSEGFGSESIGGPVLDEYGRAIGVLGGTLTPGGDGLVYMNRVSTGTAAMAVPTQSLDQPAGLDTTLGALAAKGVFPSPVVGARNVLTGTIAGRIDRRSGIPTPTDERYEWTKADTEAVAYLTWLPQETREGMTAFRIYDEDNRVVMEGKPNKLRLVPKKYLISSWTFPIGSLKPGLYRIDLVMDADPVWRSFFRVVD